MKIVDKTLLDDLTCKACESPRKRAHHNLHESLDEDIHRLCIAAEPGTYVRPHRHGDRWEMFVVLRGKVAVLTYDDSGKVAVRKELAAGGAALCVVEIPAGVWHNFASLEPGAVVMEIKRGPYRRPDENDSFSFAPREGEADAPRFEQWYSQAQAGDKIPQR